MAEKGRKPKARMGRPPKADARSDFVGLRVSRAEKVALTKAARAAGLSLGAYIMRPHRTGRRRKAK